MDGAGWNVWGGDESLDSDFPGAWHWVAFGISLVKKFLVKLSEEFLDFFFGS